MASKANLLAKASKPAAPAAAPVQLAKKIEAVLLTSGEPVPLRRLNELFATEEITKQQVEQALAHLQQIYTDSVLRLVKGAGGYMLQVTEDYADTVNKFKQEKPARYSRALMETLALIAYRQPVTKAEIEELRGVTLSTNIMRTLQEHEWIKLLGHKEVPGRPAIWGTTKTFLDSFKLSSLKELPTVEMPDETGTPGAAAPGQPAEPSGAAAAATKDNNGEHSHVNARSTKAAPAQASAVPAAAKSRPITSD